MQNTQKNIMIVTSALKANNNFAENRGENNKL